jgi:acyl carrier protein
MEEKDVFYLVKKIVVAQPGVAPDTVTMATSFTKDLGADPIAVIELEFALREEFGIEIPDVDAEKIPTVGEAVSYTRPLVEGGLRWCDEIHGPSPARTEHGHTRSTKSASICTLSGSTRYTQRSGTSTGSSLKQQGLVVSEGIAQGVAVRVERGCGGAEAEGGHA